MQQLVYLYAKQGNQRPTRQTTRSVTYLNIASSPRSSEHFLISSVFIGNRECQGKKHKKGEHKKRLHTKRRGVCKPLCNRLRSCERPILPPCERLELRHQGNVEEVSFCQVQVYHD